MNDDQQASARHISECNPALFRLTVFGICDGYSQLIAKNTYCEIEADTVFPTIGFRFRGIPSEMETRYRHKTLDSPSG